MNGLIRIAAFMAVSLGTGGLSAGDDKKPVAKPPSVEVKIKDGPKADVVVKGGDKTATAKAGQIVQMGVTPPLNPPFPMDFEVTVDGKKVESKVYDAGIHLDGRPKPTAFAKLIQFKAAGEGKQKVFMSYTQGQQKYGQAIELEVTK